MWKVFAYISGFDDGSDGQANPENPFVLPALRFVFDRLVWICRLQNVNAIICHWLTLKNEAIFDSFWAQVNAYFKIELVLSILVGRAKLRSPFVVNTSPFLSIFSSIDASIVSCVDFIFKSFTSNLSDANWINSHSKFNM